MGGRRSRAPLPDLAGQLRREYPEWEDPFQGQGQQEFAEGRISQLQQMFDPEASVWARTQEAREAVRGAQAGRAAEGQAQLARTGGLTGGARERVATAAAEAGMRAEQDIARQGQLAGLDAAQMAQRGARQDLATLIGARGQDARARQAGQKFEIERLRDIMGADAARMEAQAIRESGK